MSRSRFWHKRPPSEWSRTARTGHWRRASTSGGTAAPLRPDAASDLSDGVVVQTQLLGRVLGVRLLRIDGTVLVSPARVVSQVDARRGGVDRSSGVELAEAARLLRENDEVLRRRVPPGRQVR